LNQWGIELGALENFRLIDDSPRRVYGYDISSTTHRIGGQWRKTKPITQSNESTLQALGGILYGLPSWPLADGIDRNQFTPYTHQLLVSDTLATDWFEGIGVQPLSRSRVLVSDEGGTGKTLGVSLAVRWITIQPGSKGPVIILVPPLLKEHWAKHLRAVFNDDPERIQILGSARFFDPIRHQDEIVIMSKFSWIYHWQNREHEFKPLCVVIDEAHQGRTGMSNDNLESEEWDDEKGEVGYLQDSEEQHPPKTHARVLGRTCANAEFAIGATATPINIDTAEIEYILTMLGCEQKWSRGPNDEKNDNEEWQHQVAEITSWARNCKDEKESCPGELIEPLIGMLNDKSFPHQWTDIDDNDITALTHWLKSICEGKIPLLPKETLRRMRDFHPYGRHLSLVLRVDLPIQDEGRSQQFRIRKERTERTNVGSDMIEYLTNIQRNNISVGLLDGLGGSTRLVSSHRWNPKTTFEESNRYTGDWTFENKELSYWQEVRDIKDPRLEKLKEQIKNDLGYVDERDTEVDTQRGCVIFTEFRGTVDCLRKDIKRIATIEGVAINVFELTGATDVHAARRCLDECERLSSKENYYPVLICTPAGEVGLDMEWATTLIHWDLNSNPQRMEQRTWRLDRLISSESTRPEYTIVHMICSNIPHFKTLENLIDKRFSEAALSLGLPDRQYIPGGIVETVVKPGGSFHACALLNEEISRLNMFFHGGDVDGWPGPRLREAERLRTATVMKYCGFDEHTHSLLDSGLTLPLQVWDSQILLGDERVKKIRDLEQISTPLSRSLSPQIPKRYDEEAFVCSWEPLTKNQRFLPMNLQTAPQLFNNLMLEWDIELQIPQITTQSDVIQGNYIIALNKSIANLSSSRLSSLHDRGLRILDQNGKEILSSPDEEKIAWDLIYNAGVKLITSNELPTSPSPLKTSIHDHRGEIFVKERIDILNLRNANSRLIQQAIENQITEYGEDDEEHHRRKTKIDRIIFDLQRRDEEISKLKLLDHCLYPLLLLEVNL